jgi:hypothetical protein
MNAYTYLVGWSKHGKFYYGAQWNKYANPDDLWTKYFTSSNRVKKFREQHGEPDVIQVRREFGENGGECRDWEERVLVRLKPNKGGTWLNTRVYNKGWFSPTGSVVVKNLKTGDVRRVTRDEFLTNPDLVGQTTGMVPAINKNTGERVFATKEEFANNPDLAHYNEGRVPTESESRKASARMSGKVFAKDADGNIHHMTKDEFRSRDDLVGAGAGYTQTDDARRKIGESKIGKPRPQVVKDAVSKASTGMVAAMDIETGIVSRVSREEFESNPNLVGASRGRVIPDGEKARRRAAMKGATSGMVTCRDIRTGEKRKVPRSVFDADPHLVGMRSRIPNLV